MEDGKEASVGSRRTVRAARDGIKSSGLFFVCGSLNRPTRENRLIFAGLFLRAGLLSDPHMKIDFPMWAMAWHQSHHFPVRFHLRIVWKQNGAVSRKFYHAVVIVKCYLLLPPFQNV
jgi:hypothetical protein